MRRWLISVPVWGARCVEVFRRTALPMLKVAAGEIDADVRLIVHTDQPALFLGDGSPELPIECRALGAGYQWFNVLSRAHREVLELALFNDVVVLLTADMVVSVEALAACARVFDRGQRLVCCNATRVLDHGVIPQRPSGRVLSEWGWHNRHPLTRACTWPDGDAVDLERIYFSDADGVNVVCRMWMPHPLALMSDGRTLRFNPTVDADLITNFRLEEIHLVVSPDELAVIELSPASKTAPARDLDQAAVLDPRPMPERYHARRPVTQDSYRFALAQRIVVAGSGEGCGDDAAVQGAVLNR